MRGNLSTGLSHALAVAAALGLMSIALTNDAEAQLLGTAEDFGVLAGSTVTNTGPSVIQGNVGVSPGSAVVGFPPGSTPTGTIHAADAVAAQAQSDLTVAYNDLFSRPFDVDLTGQDLGGKVLIPGVYRFASSAQLTGLLVLDGQGNPNSEYIFQIGSTLTTASNSSVLLINGANGNNVYWAVGSSATLGTNTAFTGNIVALTSITLNTGATLTCGRALARNGAVTLDTNTITLCAATDDDGTGGDGDVDITVDELGGEGVTGAQQTAFDASRLFGSAMLARTVFPYLAVGEPGMGPQASRPPYGPQAARPGYPEKYTPLKVGPSDTEPSMVAGDYYEPRRWRVWAAGLGGSSSLDGDNGSGNLDTNVGGVAGGLDYRVNPTALIGVAGGYTDSEFSVDQLSTEGTTQGAHLGVYGVKSFGRIYLAGTAEYAHFNNDTDRIIEWLVDERARGSFNSDSFGGRLEAGWRRSLGRHFVTPFVGVDAYELEIDGFTENSQGLDGTPGILGLTYQADTVTSVTSSVGLQFDTQYALANGRVLTPFVRVAWVHEYSPERIVQSFLTAAPAALFSVDGATAAEDVARVHAGLRLDLSERIALWGFFEGDFSDRTQSYAGVGGGDVAFAGSGTGQNYAGRFGMKVAW
jgi:uncharacterized protein YhjY with autotransporter beta-barrel domain